MKLTILLLLAVSIQVSAKVNAQTITYTKRNVSLEMVFNEITKQTGYQVLYNSFMVGRTEKISLNLNNTPLKEALDIILKNKPIFYSIVGNIIVIRQKNEEGLQDAQSNLPDSREIQGIVVDSVTGNPLVGVTIRVKGNSILGTTTDVKGKFNLNIPDNAILEISFLGYKDKEVPVQGRNNLRIALATTTTGLGQLVVIGYGTQKKEDVTGAISSIGGSQINSQAIINPVQALTGLAAGVQTLQNSGEPGNTFSVLVRGDNSILGGNSPLFVVDGFPYDGALSNLNPNNIKSIEVLKDASATAIYGSRGSNGVVIIQTKNGIQGKTTIEYDAYYGFQQVTKRLNMLNAKQFATLANVRAADDGVTPFFTQSQIDSFGVGTNWQDAIFRTAPIQNHSLTVSGGGKSTTFSLSGNYINQQGVIIGSHYSQGQLMANITNNITDNWKISFHGNFSNTQSNMLNSDNKERGLGVLSGALVTPPTLPVKTNGTYTMVRAYAFSPDILENPVAMALETKDLNIDNSLVSNLVLEGTILPHLTLHESIGLQYDLSRVDYYSPTLFQQSASGTGSTSYGENAHWVNENLLTYSNQLGENGNLTVLGGMTSEETIQQGVVASATGFATNILQNNSLQSGTNPGIPNSAYSKYTLLSWLGRATYTYKDKYVLSASLRDDGSSVFGTANKWGLFPSASGAWRISQENFWTNLRTTVDNLKLRASWGESGNTAISPYQSLSLLSSIPTVFDKNLYIGFAPGSNEPNPNLKWETTSGIDIGLDMGFLNNRITATFDYYYKKTRDLLASIPVPPSSGYSSQSANIGSLQNKGYEIGVNARIINAPNFTWDIGGTFTSNRNKVLSLYAGAPIFGTAMGSALPAMNMVAVGQPIGVFYGYVETGINPTTGNIVYKDLNGDGIINSLDRTVIGNPNPKFLFGINSNLSLGSFGLSFIINSSQGNDVLAYDLSSIANGFYFGENQLAEVLGNYWTAKDPNPHAQYPIVSSATRYLGSNRYIKNGSYVRLQNIQISYSPKGRIFGGNVINHLQIYLAGQNLITLTNYPLFTPLNNTFGAGINKGIDMMGYPDARTVLLGVRINLE